MYTRIEVSTLIKKTRQELAKKVASSIVFLIAFPNPSYAAEHEMVPRDTLWDLATEHLRSPWDWPYITNTNGSQVEDVYSIPDGHKVWIPAIEDIAHLPIPFEEAGAPEIVILAAKRDQKNAFVESIQSPVEPGSEVVVHAREVQTNIQMQSDANSANNNSYGSQVSSENTQPHFEPDPLAPQTAAANPYHYLLVNKKEGLVRAFIDGQHVTMPVSKLVELYADANPGFDVKKIGDGIAISNTLIKEILGLKPKE